MERQTRQTDTTKKGYWWSITAFNDDITYLHDLQENPEKMPSWIREIWGGDELTPTTDRLHFQGALHTTEVRFSQVKKILPQSRIEHLKSDAECLKKYVMKEETAAGDKKVVSNDKYFTLEKYLLLCGKYYNEYCDNINSFSDEEVRAHLGDDEGYTYISNRVLEDKFFLIALASQPQAQRAWVKYRAVIRANARKFFQSSDP